MSTTGMKKAVAMIVAIAAMAVVGCGGGGNPEDAVSDLYAAAADGDAAKVCENLTADAQQAAADDEDADSCEEGVEKSLAGGAGELLGQIEVGEATVDGDTGTVEISALGQTDTVDVVQEDGDWKVAESAGP